MGLAKYFKKLRFSNEHHLGLGDIRITMAQQEKIVKQSTSLRKAIDEKCKDCIYDPKSGLGNWRQQVEGCTMSDCPLYPVRPRSKPKKVKKNGDTSLV